MEATMPSAISAHAGTTRGHKRAERAGTPSAALSGRSSRLLLVLIVLAAAVGGFLVTSPAVSGVAAASAGPELTRLLRAMAALKALFVGATLGVALWRLAAPVALPRLAAYAVACAVMAAGPGLIWDMAYVKAGALFLHAGLLATVLLLWRDPAMAARLSAAVDARRARLRAG